VISRRELAFLLQGPMKRGRIRNFNSGARHHGSGSPV
jgi:hypothetical protein